MVEEISNWQLPFFLITTGDWRRGYSWCEEDVCTRTAGSL